MNLDKGARMIQKEKYSHSRNIALNSELSGESSGPYIIPASCVKLSSWGGNQSLYPSYINVYLSLSHLPSLSLSKNGKKGPQINKRNVIVTIRFPQIKYQMCGSPSHHTHKKVVQMDIRFNC